MCLGTVFCHLILTCFSQFLLHQVTMSLILKFRVTSDYFEEGQWLLDWSQFWLKTGIKERWPFVIMDSSCMLSEINRRLCRLSHIHLLSQINPSTILSTSQQEHRGAFRGKLCGSASAAAAGGLEEHVNFRAFSSHQNCCSYWCHY